MRRSGANGVRETCMDDRAGLRLSQPGGASAIVKAGSAGGVVMLLGSPMPDGEWRFALATVDCTAELVNEQAPGPVDRRGLTWVDSCDEGFRLLNRYPWVQLYPQGVHPLFVEEVRLAVAERLAILPPGPRREKQRKAWERVLQATGGPCRVL